MQRKHHLNHNPVHNTEGAEFGVLLNLNGTAEVVHMSESRARQNRTRVRFAHSALPVAENMAKALTAQAKRRRQVALG